MEVRERKNEEKMKLHRNRAGRVKRMNYPEGYSILGEFEIGNIVYANCFLDFRNDFILKFVMISTIDYSKIN